MQSPPFPRYLVPPRYIYIYIYISVVCVGYESAEAITFPTRCSFGHLSWLDSWRQKRGIEVGRCVEPRGIKAVNSNRHTHTCVSDAFVSFFALLRMLAKTRHFRVSVCRLVVRAERQRSCWEDFHEIWFSVFFFLIYPRKYKFISGKNTGYTVFTRVIHALFLTKILYLNLGCVIYARKRFYVGL